MAIQWEFPSIPKGWEVTETRVDGFAWYSIEKMMAVIASLYRERDGKVWLHVSVSRTNRLPSHSDLKYVKRHWIGEDKQAIQIFPKKTEHINIHPFCLHLFHCLDGDGLPDFTSETGSL